MQFSWFNGNCLLLKVLQYPGTNRDAGLVGLKRKLVFFGNICLSWNKFTLFIVRNWELF